MHWWLLPVYTALCSWFSFWIISYFFFHPVTPLLISNWRIQGFIPKRINVWSHQIAETIIDALVTDKRIVSYLTDPTTIEPMMPFIEIKIDDFLRNKLGKAMPVVSMFVGDRTINQMKGIFMNELQSLLPAIIHRFVDESLQPEKLRPIIEKEIDQLLHNPAFMSLKATVKRQLIKTGWVAGAIGLLSGLLLVLVIYIVNMF
jgi:uncharacterized membrane protein YheB (UPF0754 family)